jgi:hypothetical protein
MFTGKNYRIATWKIMRRKLCEFFMTEIHFSTDNLLKYKQLNPAFNNRFALLLGLGLLFCLRGKYAGYYNSIFQRNLVVLFWPVFAAATDAKRQTLTVILPPQ